MVSVNYIKNDNFTLLASDPSLLLEESLNEISESVDAEVEAYVNRCEMYAIESEIMGSIDEEAQVYIESGKSNVFEKIGNAVIAMGKKIAEFIQKIIEKIKDIGFKNKTEEEKVKALLEDTKKHNPEKYKEMNKDIIAEFKNGELDFNACASIKDMREAYNEFVEIAKKKDTTPDDLSEKFEKMKKKAESADKSGVVKVAGAATTIIGAAVAIATLKSKIDSAKKTSLDAQNATAEMNAKTLAAIRELHNSADPTLQSYVSPTLKKATILKNAQLWMNKQSEGYVTRELNVIQKIGNGLREFISKNRKSGDEYRNSNDLLSHAERVGRAESLQKEREAANKRANLELDEEAKIRAKQKANSAAPVPPAGSNP